MLNYHHAWEPGEIDALWIWFRSLEGSGNVVQQIRFTCRPTGFRGCKCIPTSKHHVGRSPGWQRSPHHVVVDPDSKQGPFQSPVRPYPSISNISSCVRTQSTCHNVDVIFIIVSSVTQVIFHYLCYHVYFFYCNHVTPTLHVGLTPSFYILAGDFNSLGLCVQISKRITKRTHCRTPASSRSPQLISDCLRSRLLCSFSPFSLWDSFVIFCNCCNLLYLLL